MKIYILNYCNEEIDRIPALSKRKALAKALTLIDIKELRGKK